MLGIPAKCQRDRSEDDIVYRSSADVLDCLDVGEWNLGPSELLRPVADHVEGQTLYRRGQFRHYAQQLGRNICGIGHRLLCHVQQSRMQGQRPIEQREVGFGEPVQQGCSCIPGGRRRFYTRFLLRDRRCRRRGIHDDIHRADASNSVRHAVMDSNDESGAAVLQPHQSEIPQRPLAVQAFAHDLSGKRLEFLLRSMLEGHLANVVPNVELRIELPTRKTQIERSGHAHADDSGESAEASIRCMRGSPRALSRPSNTLTPAILSGWPGRSICRKKASPQENELFSTPFDIAVTSLTIATR